MSERVSGTKYLGVGVTWAASVGLFLYLGGLLDARFGTKPFLALVGAGIGIVAGFVWLVVQVQRDGRASAGAKRGDS